MSYKILLSLFTWFCMFLPMAVQVGSRIVPPAAVTAPSAEVVYQGTMDVSMSKGKTFKGRPATFVLRQQRLICDFPKIGKMPGKIRIELPVRIDSNGVLTAQAEGEAGVMKMPLGIKIKLRLERLHDARIEGQQLSFSMTVYGQMMGAKFPTSIQFRGTAH